MSVDYTKVIGSGSTNGKLIAVAATGTPGTAVHTAVSGTADIDELWIYAVNIDSVTRRLTIEFGGTTDADKIIIDLPAYVGLVPVVSGLVLNNAKAVAAFASSANKINLAVFINRISVL